jgi:hypothetical protein
MDDMDEEFVGKIHDFVENQDREQLRRLMNMDEPRETDAEWKRDYGYRRGSSCASCKFREAYVCEKHDADIFEDYICDLYEDYLK